MVGVEGFEPPAPCSQSMCATKLRYTPAPSGATHINIHDLQCTVKDISAGKNTEKMWVERQ